ncbi:extracellular triacylglycerol lipase precursor [Mycena rosella]|uniref:Extracellular triacylglycerol lipase n=1 Tax=Mycena rosella TaxID=1033263 RepID=A0AAD7CM90_MYCRO|nr:extracellular triacylglycerol lipase precursor [Mycena rosella]
MFPRITSILLSLIALAQSKPTVNLGNTIVTGVSFSNVEFYGGIPYAEPPVGRLLFKAPVLKRALNVPTFNATTYGIPCLQDPNTNPGAMSPSSEDCLTINIYKPAGLASTDSLPVMAYIHGGGFVAGASSTYNASAIISQSINRGTPVIYASFNYRLGPLGFPAGREAFTRHALNLGLRDQLTALQWIQDNIAVFNGDKSKVTVFGESAGAISLGVLFLNSNLEKLARAAILQSGGPATTPVFDHSRRQGDWDNFVRAVPECADGVHTGNSITCLQAANSSALLQALVTSSGQANEGYPWVPTLDGPSGLLPALPSVLFTAGKFARMPFIAGTNLDEGTFFTTPLTNSTAMIRSYLISNYTSPAVAAEKLDSAVERLLQLYPDVPALGSPFNTGNDTFGLSSQYKRYSAIMGDLMFQSQRRAWIQAASKFGVKTFGYLFTDPAPPIVIPTLGNRLASLDALGVTHTADILYVYGDEAGVGGSPSAVALSTRMIDYWVSFATSLDPNDGLGSARPVWSEYGCDAQMLLQFNGDNTTLIPDTYREEQTSFINSNAAVFSH